MKAAQEKDYSAEFDFLTRFYGSDIDALSLETQLQAFATLFQERDDRSIIQLDDIITTMKGLSAAQKSLLSEVSTLTSLMLVMPATNAVSERSFSALDLVKTYLHNSMTQERLNHLQFLYVHKDITDKLDFIEAANEFVSKSDYRLTLFGKFQQDDLALYLNN